MAKLRVGAEMMKRIRDYAVEEPSYTVAFMAWDMGISVECARLGNDELMRLGIVREIEPRSGPFAAVFAYDPPPNVTAMRRRLPLPELDAGVGALALASGAPVPHTGPAIGPSGRPGRDRKKQAQGFTVKRGRQGT